MIYYEINATFAHNNDDCKLEKLADNPRMERRARAHGYQGVTQSFNDTIHDKGYITLFFENGENAQFVMLVKNAEDKDAIFKVYTAALGLDLEPDFYYKELTFREFRDNLNQADNFDFIPDADTVMDSFSISNLGGYGHDFGENLLPETKPEEVDAFIERNLLSNTMKPEVERIRMGKATKSTAIGIPVHYCLELSAQNHDLRREAYRMLLSELFRSGRIQSRRYSFFDTGTEDDPNEKYLNYLYNTMVGGSVVIRYSPVSESNSDTATSGNTANEIIARLICKFKNKVQTILLLPTSSSVIKNAIFSDMENVAMVNITEDVVFDANAEKYLSILCKEQSVKPNKKLFDAVESGKAYNAYDLNGIFDKWYSERLCNHIYPQYKAIESVKEQVREEKPQGSAYERLRSLIGLKDCKRMTDKILNYYKAQKLFADRGLIQTKPYLHILLSGNPGTAKTTYARLLGEILKDNKIIENGKFFELGRADLVGKYVGHTAPIVKKRFNDAVGSVLLIDEAYSLVDDRTGLYGDEAINTIVQCLENMPDVVVIFAGYTDRMQNFLDRNPGLRSRINFNIHCDDYTPDELCDIAKLMAKNNGMSITDEAVDKIRRISESVCGTKDFGNGRFIRNIIDDAKMKLSDRLVSMKYGTVTDDDIRTITAEDIDAPVMLNAETDKRKPIGFLA